MEELILLRASDIEFTFIHTGETFSDSCVNEIPEAIKMG